MRKEGLETLTLIGYITDKRRQWAIYLINLCEWIVELGVGSLAKVPTLLKATRERMLWRAMIAHGMKAMAHRRLQMVI